MKLNYKRTLLVGFAFFLICAFWQIYDVTIAMTLTSKFGLSQTASGVVMALDNILALFMLLAIVLGPIPKALAETTGETSAAEAALTATAAEFTTSPTRSRTAR